MRSQLKQHKVSIGEKNEEFYTVYVVATLINEEIELNKIVTWSALVILRFDYYLYFLLSAKSCSNEAGAIFPFGNTPTSQVITPSCELICCV